MNYRDYNEIKIGKYSSVGKFGNGVYAFRHIEGAVFHSTYYTITEREFKEYPENEYELAMFHFEKSIKICSDYLGDTEFDETEILNNYRRQ